MFLFYVFLTLVPLHLLLWQPSWPPVVFLVVPVLLPVIYEAVWQAPCGLNSDLQTMPPEPPRIEEVLGAVSGRYEKHEC